MTTATPNLNPYLDRGPWGRIQFDDFDPFPAILQSVDGFEKPEDWNGQKGTGSSGATNVWKGTKLAEGGKVVFVANDASQFDQFYKLRDKLRPSPGKKPPSVAVANAFINFNGITRIAQALIGQPKWQEGAKNNYSIEITLTEYDPSKNANTGAASPTKWKDQPTANDEAEAELQKAINAAKSV